MIKLKSIIFGAALLLSGTALAQEYNSISFVKTDGSTTNVNCDNLEITVESGNLLISHKDGQLSMPLSELSKFYFSQQSASVESIGVDLDSAVTVYSLTGYILGSYPGIEDAQKSLPYGVYIFKIGDKTFKGIVK